MKKLKKTLSLILLLMLAVCLTSCTSAVNNAVFISRSTNFEIPDESAGIMINPGKLVYADVENISQELGAEYPEEDISVVPVYNNEANKFVNDEIIHIYGVDPEFAAHLGLEEMKNGIAYFSTEQSGEVELEICVLTEETPDGLTFGETAYMTLSAHDGVSEKGLLKKLRDEYFMPGMLEDQICFVTTETFLEITSLALGEDVNTFEEAEKASGIVEMIGIYICAENTEEIKSCLAELRYE